MSIPELSYSLRGKLYLSSSGWILLSVPNALGRGAFEALREPGTELPGAREGGYNAHISVIRPEELEQIGGPDKIDERGHEFSFTLGPVRSVTPTSWDGVSKVWFIEVQSPELERLRKSYGLPALPNDNRYKFHITFAVRRRGVLRESSITKLAVFAAEKEARRRIQQLPGCQLITSFYLPRTDEIWAESLDPALDTYLPEALRQLGVKDAADRPDDAALLTSAGVEVLPSAVHGYGLYARRRFDAGEVVIPAAMHKMGKVLGYTRYEQDPTSRYCNHSDTPNIMLVDGEKTASLVATCDICPGDEILAKYSNITAALEHPFVYTYRDKVFGKQAEWDFGQNIDKMLQGNPEQPSIYMQALRQVPFQYQPQAGVVGSLGDYLQRAKTKGDMMRQEGHSWERFQSAMDPTYSNRRFQELLSGQRPAMFSHPIDRLISGS